MKVNVRNDYTLLYAFGVDLEQTNVQHTCLHRRLYLSSTVVVKLLLVSVSVSVSEQAKSIGIGSIGKLCYRFHPSYYKD